MEVYLRLVEANPEDAPDLVIAGDSSLRPTCRSSLPNLIVSLFPSRHRRPLSSSRRPLRRQGAREGYFGELDFREAQQSRRQRSLLRPFFLSSPFPRRV